MATIRMVCGLALWIAGAMVATTPTWAGPNVQDRGAGPLPPRETVYVPDCWPDLALIDVGLPRCVRPPE
jgi:hypothetical protein